MQREKVVCIANPPFRPPVYSGIAPFMMYPGVNLESNRSLGANALTSFPSGLFSGLTSLTSLCVFTWCRGASNVWHCIAGA